ncbi:MAG: roadblock/LC7 domain-containing protein [candidate division NC10 bacterium]|nr:roadblock/LC7 domain-containing protein [candidate division NC10 bacterium]MBI2163019.1 roadblock/LC7 domain-containing protein [candidate division NC10 bacterium]MBI2455737.1 roadblock/LC7 domain-containing protein [candidate division NC10 bacterium]MBI2563579.1 roadblock/LC7 domain-containing protein [candidate division NC10 bacterium]MBI3085376.1 roadblock/LC7 domain-containing protein [candidate division NC10 bacterium]
MASPDLQTVLDSLLNRVAGARGAILVDQDGVLIARASRGPAVDLDAAGAGAGLLLRETLAAAGHLGHGTVGEVLLEAERGTLAVIPLKNTCCLCLLLGPDAVLGRGLFEARRAAFALDQSL